MLAAYLQSISLEEVELSESTQSYLDSVSTESYLISMESETSLLDSISTESYLISMESETSLLESISTASYLASVSTGKLITDCAAWIPTFSPSSFVESDLFNSSDFASTTGPNAKFVKTTLKFPTSSAMTLNLTNSSVILNYCWDDTKVCTNYRENPNTNGQVTLWIQLSGFGSFKVTGKYRSVMYRLNYSH